MDAMDEGARERDWERLAPEELDKLRVGAQVAGTWDLRKEAGEPGAQVEDGRAEQGDGDGGDYGWRAGSASR
jgi:hypothetical protein